MTIPTAEAVFFAIVAVLGIVWLGGVRFAYSRLRPPRRGADLGDRLDEADRGGRSEVRGETLVEAPREEVAGRLAALLADVRSPMGLPALRVTAAAADRVAFERAPGASGLRLLPAGRGEFALRAEGDRTRVRYSLDLSRFYRGMGLATFLVCFVYGGLFVLGVPIVVWLLVVHDDRDAVRMQVLQTAQMVHGVWPPFLLGAISSRGARASQAFVDTLLAAVSPRPPVDTSEESGL